MQPPVHPLSRCPRGFLDIAPQQERCDILGTEHRRHGQLGVVPAHLAMSGEVIIILCLAMYMYVSYRESLREYTRRCPNDVAAHGSAHLEGAVLPELRADAGRLPQNHARAANG